MRSKIEQNIINILVLKYENLVRFMLKTTTKKVLLKSSHCDGAFFFLLNVAKILYFSFLNIPHVHTIAWH